MHMLDGVVNFVSQNSIFGWTTICSIQQVSEIWTSICFSKFPSLTIWVHQNLKNIYLSICYEHLDKDFEDVGMYQIFWNINLTLSK